MTVEAIEVEFDDLWLHATPEGWKYSEGGDEQDAPIHLRAFIQAENRDDWHIISIDVITTGVDYKAAPGSSDRIVEYRSSMEGKLFEETREFLERVYTDRLQEKVDLNVLPSYDDIEPYRPVTL